MDLQSREEYTSRDAVGVEVRESRHSFLNDRV